MSLFSANHVTGLARVTPAPINSLVTNHSPRWRAYQKSINNYDAPCIVLSNASGKIFYQVIAKRLLKFLVSNDYLK